MSDYVNNIVYGIKSFMIGMKHTWKHFINKKELAATLQYPHEKWPIPERNIGFDHSEYNVIRSRLHVDIDDCIACMQCERACPVDCIKIDSIKPSKDNDYDCGMTSNDTQKKMIVSRFTIDMSECMYCNLCVYPCPEECIYMVGGPNATKHEIDYEFSQYKRDGMIFEFADASDEDIINAGGQKWIDKRDAKLHDISQGEKLNGNVVTLDDEPKIEKKEVNNNDKDNVLGKTNKKKNDEFGLISFNQISDKMCRGISKKAFTAGKRAGKDDIAIIADVGQALQDAGKLTDDIQSILDLLIQPESNDVISSSEEIVDKIKKNIDSDNDGANIPEVKDIDIKDLNAIDDKMARGIAKKAFISAKRNELNKIEEIIKALQTADKYNESIKALLDKYSSADSNNQENINKASSEEEGISIEVAKPLFPITDLNKIEDKMIRGISKKIYTSGKRSQKNSIEIIDEIKASLKESKKLNEDLISILDSINT